MSISQQLLTVSVCMVGIAKESDFDKIGFVNWHKLECMLKWKRELAPRKSCSKATKFLLFHCQLENLFWHHWWAHQQPYELRPYKKETLPGAIQIKLLWVVTRLYMLLCNVVTVLIQIQTWSKFKFKPGTVSFHAHRQILCLLRYLAQYMFWLKSCNKHNIYL